MTTFQNKSVLVTGACGTVGSALIKYLASGTSGRPAHIMGIDHGETEIFDLDQQWSSEPTVTVQLADVRDVHGLIPLFREVDIVFHAAALKHVILCEQAPMEAVRTNIIGVQNVIRAAREGGVERVVFTSSDKAVNPTNVMGTSKLMGERLMTAANTNRRNGDPIFTSTRFGNVLGSRGSVLPIFARQIRAGGPLTITNEEMTRFVMTIEESVRLVVESAMLACGGEVFITKMPVVRIPDLAKAAIEELAPEFGREPYAIDTTIIGSKAGEKLYEELMTEEETTRAIELERYFVVLPAFRNLYEEISYNYSDDQRTGVDRPYVSRTEPAMTVEEIRSWLRESGLASNCVQAVTAD
ncbi:MAG: polysaccharide biosynthesis protein [Phycisphaerales bacterium]|nr:polysaccharide biosynthesis protein [Phycisphaerales bacterium]HJN81100.1 polysaccharide biosynthesis protein [Phycisphaerales bacterium]